MGHGGHFRSRFDPALLVLEIYEGGGAKGTMCGTATAHREVGAQAAERRVEWSCRRSCMKQQRIVTVVSHVAELGLFFAAAAVLGAGLLGLK
jgi:hypothetical protein